MSLLEKLAAKTKPCPGSKIRSKGKGRGLGYGKAKGPMGVPVGEKVEEQEKKSSLLEKLAKKKGEKIESGELKGGKDEPSSKAKPGEGGRFEALKKKLSKKKGVKDPGALAAQLGRAKFGKKKFQSMSAKGK